MHCRTVDLPPHMQHLHRFCRLLAATEGQQPPPKLDALLDAVGGQLREWSDGECL
jgi:hypothetical protein